MAVFFVLFYILICQFCAAEAGFRTIKNKTKPKTIEDFHTKKRNEVVSLKKVLLNPPAFDFSNTVVKEGDETDNVKIAARAASSEVRQQLADVSFSTKKNIIDKSIPFVTLYSSKQTKL